MNGLDTSGNREIRIFLSSTFSDMQEERNYLTKKIFPSIREACEKRGVSFTVLDLRWGITEEASRTGKVIEICMDEIRRTKPFFIGLLGGRYGWIPTEKETGLNRHLTEKYPWITEYLKSGCSITEIEMQYAVLAGTDDIDAFFFLREMESVPARFREKDGSLEKEKLGFHKRVYEGFCDIARSDSERVVAVDASRPREQVLDSVLAEMKKRGIIG